MNWDDCTSSHVSVKLRPMASALLALGVALVALDHGGYTVETRGAVAILLWWALLVLAALGVWPRASPPRVALVAGGLLCALTALTGVSALWSDSEERAFQELGRVGLYLGAFTTTIAAARRMSVAAWTDGLAAGVATVGVLAIVGRCLSWDDWSDLRAFLPGTETRLGYPLGYYNGLAIMLGIGVPLLLRAAVDARTSALRALAVGALPPLGAALYLTSSRGGVAVAVVGALAFVLLSGRAVPTLFALLAGGLGAAASIAVLEARPELVDGPLAAAEAAGQGESALPLLLGAAVASGAVYALVSRTGAARAGFPRRAAAGAVAVGLVLMLAGAVAADPAARFDDFREPPNEQPTDRQGFVREHLISSEGSGRWQLWRAAVDQFQQHPLVGDGAGSYGAWWLRHGSIAFYVEDAHSLYLEMLGELGALGCLLLVGAFGCALVAGVRRLHATTGAAHAGVAAVFAALLGFMTGAAIDWIWELTLVGLMGVVCVGLLTGPATAPADERSLAVGPRGRFAARTGLALLAVALIAVEGIPWMVDRQLQASREALAEGDAATAESRALEARAIQPWAVSPHLQLALVREHERDLEGARRAIVRAAELEPGNWRVWVVAARIAAGAGHPRRAARSLRRARTLYPRSPLLKRRSEPL